MQATSTKRFVRSRAGGMAAVFSVLLIGVVAILMVTLSTGATQGETSAAHPATVSDVIQYDRMKFLEENVMYQLPYVAPPTPSYNWRQGEGLVDPTYHRSQTSVIKAYPSPGQLERETWSFQADDTGAR